ncbi:MAG: VOC family protein, partial [Gemmatimonadota bacterium]
GSRERPDGTRLSWLLTDPGVVVGDGLVPFLIDWGDSEHPARAAPAGCELSELRAEHPEPERIRPMLAALDVSLPVAAGPRPALVATIRAPRGIVELR